VQIIDQSSTRAPPTRQRTQDEPGGNVYVGQEIERTEDFRFLTGRGLRRRLRAGRPAPRSHFAQPVPHGECRDRCSGRLRMPGVYAVICARDIGPTIPRIPSGWHRSRALKISAAGDRGG
jgi:hypothetical protein